MKRIAICLAPALLLAAGHATAAGPLLAGLQPRLNAAVPTLAASALPALPAMQAALGADSALPALAGRPLSGLESDVGPTATDWLDYNLNYWPGEVQAWVAETQVHLASESSAFVWGAATLPSNSEACDSSVCPTERRIAAHTANMVKGADRVLGLGAPRPPAPPLPFLPPDVPYWLYHDYTFYPAEVTAWLAAEDEFTVGKVQDLIHDVGRVGDAIADPQYFIGRVTDGALGLAAPRPPLPLPHMPGGAY